MEPLKNIYNDRFFAELKTTLPKAIPGFDTRKFLFAVKNKEWPLMELKQRMRHLSTVLHDQLDGSYKNKLANILKLANNLPANTEVQYSSLAYMYIPDFLAQYGLADVEISLNAMEKINMITSCEFAIRPFLLANEKLVMDKMLAWSKHPHESIRRFASEGCRPRLPWGAAIPSFKKDPSLILPILENLKADTSVYVQKSVANNLNDISKDHPALVVKIAKRWQHYSPATNWIIKHACRGLLKAGHKEVLHLFGTGAHVKCTIKNFALYPAIVRVGDLINFRFHLQLLNKEAAKLRVEYGIHYKKLNGSFSRKIFKIAEAVYEPGKDYVINRKHSFKDLTTRKHYPGQHSIVIIVNGNEIVKKNIMLIL